MFVPPRPVPVPTPTPTSAPGPSGAEPVPGSEEARLARIQELKAGHTFPKWDHQTNTFVRSWTVPEMTAASDVVNNALAEMTESAIDHAQRRKYQRKYPQEYVDMNQGPLDRRNIWKRTMESDASCSMVVKVEGLVIDDKMNGTGKDKEGTAKSQLRR